MASLPNSYRFRLKFITKLFADTLALAYPVPGSQMTQGHSPV